MTAPPATAVALRPANDQQDEPWLPFWRDSTTYILLWIALLVALPGKLVFAPLGAAGRPAMLLGLALLWLWISHRAVRRPGAGGSPWWRPIHWLLLLYVLYMASGFVIAGARSLTPLEVTTMQRGYLALASGCGIVLVVADGASTRKRLDRVLGFLVAAGALMATVGIIQFITGFDPVPYIKVPGLQNGLSFEEIPTRSIFNRPYGTALHPIEFGVVTAALLPIGIHFGRYALTRRGRTLAWLATGVLAFAAPMSLSRSGIIVLAVAAFYYGVGLTWRERVTGFGFFCAFIIIMMVTIPGLLGTLKGLFTYADVDPSITARRERVPKVLDLIAERPWFGRGYSTYTPEDYFLLDNQVFETAIESGIVGVVVTATLIFGSVILTWQVRKRAQAEDVRHLAQVIGAPLVGLAVATYTFDAFYYPAYTGMLFLLIGSAGALWAIVLRNTTGDHVATAP